MIRLVLASLATAAGAAAAGVETQSFAFDYNPLVETQSYAVQGFDTQGGTRRLDNIAMSWTYRYELDFTVENTGPTAVAAEDFSLNIEMFTLFDAGPADDSYFAVYGGIFVPVSYDLAAGDNGINPDGTNVVSDSYDSGTATNTLDFNTFAIDRLSRDLVDAGTVEFTTLTAAGAGFAWINEPIGWDPPSGPFGEPSYPNDDAIWLTLESARHSGSWTLTYEYTVIPSPATTGLIALGGLVAARRRR